MALMSMWPADGNCHQSVCVSEVLPEGDGPRICLRASAWLWLMGCVTRELALILGLYTCKCKDSVLSIRPVPCSRLPGREATAVQQAAPRNAHCGLLGACSSITASRAWGWRRQVL